MELIVVRKLVRDLERYAKLCGKQNRKSNLENGVVL